MSDRAYELIDCCLRRYAELDTYQDVGRILFPSTDIREPYLEKFKTTFVRNRLFKFELLTPSPHQSFDPVFDYTLIHFDGEQTHVLQLSEGESPEITVRESLDNAIGAFTGSSSGATQSIAKLLMPDVISGWGFGNLLYATCDSSEVTSDGVELNHIAGKGPMNHDLVLSLTKFDHLFVRRARRQVKSDLWTEEIRRCILMNEQVSVGAFDRFSAAAAAKEAIGAWENW